MRNVIHVKSLPHKARMHRSIQPVYNCPLDQFFSPLLWKVPELHTELLQYHWMEMIAIAIVHTKTKLLHTPHTSLKEFFIHFMVRCRMVDEQRPCFFFLQLRSLLNTWCSSPTTSVELSNSAWHTLPRKSSKSLHTEPCKWWFYEFLPFHIDQSLELC